MNKCLYDFKNIKEISKNYDSKRIPLSGQEREKIIGKYPYYGATKIMDYINDFIFDGTFVLISEDGSVEDKNGYPILQLPTGKFWVSNHAHVLQGKNDIETKFIFYALQTIKIKPFLTGSVQLKLSQSNLNCIKIPYPKSSLLREKIVSILSVLDEKIELNNKKNKILQEISKALFNSWFVDFDPVRAKSEGRSTQLEQKINEFFPDSFEDSELGEIPKGWKISNIGKISEVIDCLHSKKPVRQNNGNLLLQLNNINDNGILDISDKFFITDGDYKKWTSRMETKSGDCVITNVGRVGAVSQIPSNVKAALGRNMTAIRARDEFPYPTFILEYLLSRLGRNEIKLNIDVGTILDALNVKSIPNLRLVLPNNDLCRHYENLSRPFREKMEKIHIENESIYLLRNTLLPKLISGEIGISNAKNVLEEEDIL